jgi:hypothetical protein
VVIQSILPLSTTKELKPSLERLFHHLKGTSPPAKEGSLARLLSKPHQPKPLKKEEPKLSSKHSGQADQMIDGFFLLIT